MKTIFDFYSEEELSSFVYDIKPVKGYTIINGGKVPINIYPTKKSCEDKINIFSLLRDTMIEHGFIELAKNYEIKRRAYLKLFLKTKY